MTEQQIREKFDKEWNEYKFSINKTDHYDGADEDKIIAWFFSIRTQEREELEKKIGGMKQRTCDCENEEEGLGYHTKYCDFRPYGYNQALQDIKALLKEQ